MFNSKINYSSILVHKRARLFYEDNRNIAIKKIVIHETEDLTTGFEGNCLILTSVQFAIAYWIPFQ